MYGLKKEIDLSFLTGRELEQVAIGLYHFRFGFDEDVAISVEAEFATSTDRMNRFGDRRSIPLKLQPVP